MAAFTAGQRFSASLLNRTLGASVADTQNSLANRSGTTFSETLDTDNTPCAVVFVAPASGSVLVHNSAWLDSNGNSRTLLGWIVRTGDKVGAGTAVQFAQEEDAISSVTVSDVTVGRTTMLTGLTPGASYNMRQAGKVSAGIGEFQDRHLVVQPVV